ncbi:MAG TPA: hypothetical protein VEK08_20045 [Planctomycetota bacterium]|nr:hypothetical protein [Planctomycetota bacterium]
MQNDPPRSKLQTFLAGVLIIGGLVALLFAFVGLAALSRPEAEIFNLEITRLKNQNSSGWYSHAGIALQPATVSMLFTFGALAAFGGLLCYRRRFSLKSMLIAVLLIGLLGSLPALIYKTLYPTAVFSIHFDKPFSAAQLESMQTALQPFAAFATLPDNLVPEMPLQSAIKSATLASRQGPAALGARLTLEIDPHLSLKQRNTLIAFYSHYFYTLAAEAARSNGCEFGHDSPYNPGFSREWTAAIPEWTQLRKKSSAPQPQSAINDSNSNQSR